MKIRKLLFMITAITTVLPVIVDAKSGNRPMALHALSAGADSTDIPVKCPTTVSVGVINVPQGWFSFSARVFQFNSLRITYAPQTKKINVICQYGSQDEHSIVYEVPSNYVCKEIERRVVECKRIIGPTKK